MRLIAEIGNNFMGDILNAKEMIRIAKECGADLVKGQAFRAEDIKSGSMPLDFYQQCELTEDQYIELIEYGEDIKIPVFYSVFSGGFKKLRQKQKYLKISAHQFLNDQYKNSDLEPTTFVSAPTGTWLKTVRFANVLHVSEYMTNDPKMGSIEVMKKYYNRDDIGYSDHTMGIKSCIIAKEKFKCHVIEKHFCLQKNIKYNGIIFRDTVHAADPKEFEQLALKVKGG